VETAYFPYKFFVILQLSLVPVFCYTYKAVQATDGMLYRLTKYCCMCLKQKLLRSVVYVRYKMFLRWAISQKSDEFWVELHVK